MRWLITAVAGLGLIAQTALAQGEPSVAGRGHHSILVGTGSGTSVGYGLRVGARTDLELQGGVRVVNEGDSNSRAIPLRAGLKLYLTSSDAEISPYVLFGPAAVWTRLKSDSGFETASGQLGAFIALGVSWFPHRRLSVGGHVGLEGSAVRTERPQSVLPIPAPEVVTGHDVGTFSSGIRIQLYF